MIMYEQEEKTSSQENENVEKSIEEIADSVTDLVGDDQAESLGNLTEIYDEPVEETTLDTDATDDQMGIPKPDVESPTVDFHPESKTRAFFRRFLRWSAGLLIVFGLGLIAGIYGLYRPALRESDQIKTQLESEIEISNRKIQELDDQIKGMNSRITELQPYLDENEKLLNQQNELQLNIAILKTRLDIANAALALSLDDPAQAQLILEKTNDNLDRINLYLQVDQREVIKDLKTRLEWVLDDIGIDNETAQTDLNVIGAKLLQLEDALINK
jgi:hypothetical protein